MGRITDANGILISDLWVDQPDALQQLELRAAKDELSPRDVEEARRFIGDGYAVLDLDLPESLTRQIDADIERIWRERPRDFAYGSNIGALGGDFAMSDIPAHFDRSEPKTYRFCCAHSHSDALQSLFFDQTIHRFMSFTFGQPCVAVSTLYFEYGSRQGKHRDTSVVSFDPLTHLGAVWIALEDIDPDSGPLEYMPGSHRIENYFFPDGSMIWHPKYGDNAFSDMADGIHRAAAKHGLHTEQFLARRGQALFWHHSLSHGGSAVRRPELTRKSLVIHFTTLAAFKSRDHSLVVKPDGCEEYWRFEISDPAIEIRNGCYGAKSAIKDWHLKPLPPMRPALRTPNLALIDQIEFGRIEFRGEPANETMVGCLDASSMGEGCLVMSGWALDKVRQRPADNIVVTMGDRPIHFATTDHLRRDVADAFKSSTVAYSGFYLLVPNERIKAATGALRVWAVSDDGRLSELTYFDGYANFAAGAAGLLQPPRPMEQLSG